MNRKIKPMKLKAVYHPNSTHGYEELPDSLYRDLTDDEKNSLNRATLVQAIVGIGVATAALLSFCQLLPVHESHLIEITIFMLVFLGAVFYLGVGLFLFRTGRETRLRENCRFCGSPLEVLTGQTYASEVKEICHHCRRFYAYFTVSSD